jgi:hypothetical protein
LISSRIGHLTANTELYIREVKAAINTPDKPFMDFVYHGAHRNCNKQLAKIWHRSFPIGPKWILEPAFVLNKLIPGRVKRTAPPPFQFGRDVQNLFEKSDCHISFTNEEEARGLAELEKMGIPTGAEFICLNVRDNLYLNEVIPTSGKWTYHDYRGSERDNYLLAAETPADLGYYVVRMAAVAKKPLDSSHPKVIDYAF